MQRKRNAARNRRENLRQALVSPGLTTRAEACLGRRLLLAAVLVELPVLAAFAGFQESRPEIAVYVIYGAAVLLVLLRRTLSLRRRPADHSPGNRVTAESNSPAPGSE